MKAALSVDNLSKQYRLGMGPRGEYRTLRESLVGAVTAPWRRRHPDGGSDTLWALRQVSFEVRPGEVVGVIGRNGAGKSTLLKILSRVTEPTEGRARLRGRIGSLLEVGTGFHAELTGRENIFLSGAILGMGRKEIARKFDEIVAFSEIEPFLDTPVKRYSSGMYVRLAFAVAAHLEPEILVVDEVLAVGDVAFQKKCLRRMQEAAGEGRTILFVSHNLSALQALCRRGLLLERGRLTLDGRVSEAVAHYLSRLEATASIDLAHRTDRGGAGRVRLVRVDVRGEGPDEAGRLRMGHPARFTFHLSAPTAGATCIFSILDPYGHPVCKFNSGLGDLEDGTADGPPGALVCAVEELLLAPGRYRIDAAVRVSDELQDRVEAVTFFDVVRGPVRGREPPHTPGDWLFCQPHRWQPRTGGHATQPS
jgi:lipopolysaccharide transport system ATP-binding protein